MFLVLATAWASPPDDTLTIDLYAGGLAQAMFTMTARHGLLMTYEAVTGDIEGVNYRLEGNGLRDAALRPLKFSYPANANPRQVAEAAVAAYNAIPSVDAHYTVRPAGPVLHLVPYEVYTAGGAYVPYPSLLDVRLTLADPTATPEALKEQIRLGLQAATGVTVTDGLEGSGMKTGPDLLGFVHYEEDDLRSWFPPPRQEVTIPAEGTARELLDAVLLAEGVDVTNWWWAWGLMDCRQPPPGSHECVPAYGWVLNWHRSTSNDK